MPTTSAGLLLYRHQPDLQVLLGHMGGPYWSRKDEGAWSIPKGEYGPDEDSFQAAQREFAEELGTAPPQTRWSALGTAAVSSSKMVTVWAGEAEFDADAAVSGLFELEWPRGSGTFELFPELDRAAWFATAVARRKLVRAQTVFVDRLEQLLSQKP